MRFNMRVNYAASALAVVLMLVATAAVAQVIVPAPAPGTIDFAGLWAFVEKLVLDGLVAAVLALAGWGAMLLKNKLGIDIGTGYQAMLESLATNAGRAVLAHVENVGTFKIRVGNQLIADAANKFIDDVPQAVLRFFNVPEGGEELWFQQHIVAALGELTKHEPDNGNPNPTTMN